jgi:hypothetical protein
MLQVDLENLTIKQRNKQGTDGTSRRNESKLTVIGRQFAYPSVIIQEDYHRRRL